MKTIAQYQNRTPAEIDHPEAAADLWNWAKVELQKVSQSGWYGNLYTKGIAAAKAMDDSYGKQLEKEYENFLANFRS